MRELRKIFLGAVASVFLAHAAFAGTPGVTDIVTCVKAGGTDAIVFQTLFGGGDSTGSGICNASTTYCVGLGTGTNALPPNSGQTARMGIELSRNNGNPLNFTDQGAGYYGDCASAYHGVTGISH